MKYIFPVLLFSLFILVCDRNIQNPSTDVPPDILKLSVDTLQLGQQTFILRTELWRDFMPISPPDGRPLTAYIEIETVDSSAITLDMDSDRIYIVNGEDVWASSYAEELPDDYPARQPFRIVKIARDGPKWGPNIYVDVIVRIVAEGSTYFLRAKNQHIGMTW